MSIQGCLHYAPIGGIMVEKIDKSLTTLTLLGIFLPAVLWTDFTTRAAEPESPGVKQSEIELFETAYKFHMGGELEKAIHFYKLSIERKPTAKAHTFLGWALSHQGKYDEAIAECFKAIEIDPEYGNPYNDIGAYYIQKEMYDEAVPFLKKAIEAKNYENYQFPHFNLGMVYLVKGMYHKAMEEFKKALEIDPNYLAARIYLEIVSRYLVKEI
jgi:tetratricopeptide (TPR) repeat protein